MIAPDGAAVCTHAGPVEVVEDAEFELDELEEVEDELVILTDDEVELLKDGDPIMARKQLSWLQPCRSSWGLADAAANKDARATKVFMISIFMKQLLPWMERSCQIDVGDNGILILDDMPTEAPGKMFNVPCKTLKLRIAGGK